MTGQLHALNYLNGAEAESSHQLHGRNNKDITETEETGGYFYETWVYHIHP
mgnify:CR=1 FL=1